MNAEFETPYALKCRLKAAEAREAALVACLREARDGIKTAMVEIEEVEHRLFRASDLHDNMEHWLRMGDMQTDLRERARNPLWTIRDRIDALLAAQPRQEQAWKPYCVKCNRLMESILTCPFCGGHEASATQCLREHGADSPEAGRERI